VVSRAIPDTIHAAIANRVAVSASQRRNNSIDAVLAQQRRLRRTFSSA